MLTINEQMWLYVMKTTTYRRYYNNNIERNLESDTLGDLVLLFTNMCYFQEPWKYETNILIRHHIARLGIPSLPH